MTRSKRAPRRDLREQFSITTNLQQFPEIARHVGLYTATFANAELPLWAIYSIILGMEDIEAIMLLGDIQSFTVKLSAVERIFVRRKDSFAPYAGIFETVFDLAKKVNKFRNKLAHGLYVTDESKSKVYIHAHQSDPKRKHPAKGTMFHDTDDFFQLTEKRLTTELQLINRLREEAIIAVRAFRPSLLSSA
jgi:hypothetical protein